MCKHSYRLGFVTIRAGRPDLKWWTFECKYCRDYQKVASDKFWNMFPKDIIYI